MREYIRRLAFLGVSLIQCRVQAGWRVTNIAQSRRQLYCLLIDMLGSDLTGAFTHADITHAWEPSTPGLLL